MTRTILPRNNFFDGQEISETDMDVEQIAWHDTIANNVDLLAGSGVEKEFPAQRVLFDSNDVPESTQTLMDNEEFDGEPIYEEDDSGLAVFIQPSDTVEGSQLEIEISGATLRGNLKTKVYIFGQGIADEFIYEVLEFSTNESQVTSKYFANIIAFMTQDFKGNQNVLVTGTACRVAGGRLRILEALPMTVVRDPIMAEQITEPNMYFVNFKPADMSKSLNTILVEIASIESLTASDLNIKTTSTRSRELPKDDSAGILIGEKFKATTNNIQKVSILLSATEDTLATPGNEFDWSGDIVVGIRKLQETTQCPTDTIPGLSIDFDPEPSVLAEVAFNQDELEDLGIILNGSAQIVDFVFTRSLISNPSVAPDLEVGKYYIITIGRSGDISKGDLVLEEAANTNTDETVEDIMRLSVFSQNKWTDVLDSDLWFRVYTSAIRITSGTAIDNGVQISTPKTKTNSVTGASESYIEGKASLLSISSTTDNYVIIQKANNYTTSIPHPSTGNPVFTRIEDTPDLSVVSESTLTTLIDAGNETIILGSAVDINPISNERIEDIVRYPGLVAATTFTIIKPTSDVLLYNLVGSVLTPNTNFENLKYRVTAAVTYTDAYGDVNGDGEIDINDVARAQAIEGFSKDLVSGSLSSAEQLASIVDGSVTMDEILRADVTQDGEIDVYDAQAIQQHISLGTAFDAGSSFKRVVLTVENLTNPITTTTDMLTADGSFNSVPFTELTYRIEPALIWDPENIVITDMRRFVTKTFTTLESSDVTEDKVGGYNTMFVPNDIMVGGNILNLDGTNYAVDFEVGTVVLELPEGSTQGEIDIFDNFVKDKMKFADGTYVETGALESNQVWASASIQSFVKDLADGYDYESSDGYDTIDETIAVLYTQSSGVLRIRANNIKNIITRPELRTKILLTVYLKKAGFKNTEETVSDSTVSDLLTAIS